MKTNILKRISALAMTAVMAFSISGGVSAADAATATIDTSRSTSLTLYKYDLTGAENDGVWDSQSYVSTGIADEQVNTALSQYAIQGVEFTYRKLADLSIYKGTAADGHQETVPLYAFTENTKTGSTETIDFLSALGLTTNDAYRTDHDGTYDRSGQQPLSRRPLPPRPLSFFRTQIHRVPFPLPFLPNKRAASCGACGSSKRELSCTGAAD